MPTNSAEIKLDLVRESNFLIEESDTRITITGTSFAMPSIQSESFSTKDLAIRAYELTLTDSLALPGKNVSIVCRKLIVANPLTISVNGKDGKPHLMAANNGRAPGAHGASGLKGEDGKVAGSIALTIGEVVGGELTLEAVGGNGAKGQDGGNGQPGRNGGNAGDRRTNQSDEGAGRRGGNGLPGGDAGAGGPGGDAGAGGVVTVECNDPGSAEDLIHIKIGAGSAGLGGKAGSPGGGGRPGQGGKGTRCEYRDRPTGLDL